MGIHSLPIRRWGQIGLVALLGLTLALVTVSAGHATSGHAVTAKKKCKKKSKKSADAAKKKKCKKKKKQTVVPPVVAPPVTPPATGHTLRASLSFNDVTTQADLDLYVWDADGNLAYFDGNTIPDSETTSNTDSPEEFFDLRLPSTRDFTYGVCAYSDGSDELTDTAVDYTLDAPGDSPPFSDNGTLHGTGDTALYVGPYDPDPGNTGNWCITYLTP
jgi:hypothetical protein